MDYGVQKVCVPKTSDLRSLAMAQGNEWAADNRDRVAREMTPEQLAEAEKLAADWTPDPKACEA